MPYGRRHAGCVMEVGRRWRRDRVHVCPTVAGVLVGRVPGILGAGRARCQRHLRGTVPERAPLPGRAGCAAGGPNIRAVRAGRNYGQRCAGDLGTLRPSGRKQLGLGRVASGALRHRRPQRTWPDPAADLCPRARQRGITPRGRRRDPVPDAPACHSRLMVGHLPAHRPGRLWPALLPGEHLRLADGRRAQHGRSSQG
jgi:hypothetical protein